MMMEPDKLEGYKEFEDLWNELQLLELNADQRIDPKNYLSSVQCIPPLL